MIGEDIRMDHERENGMIEIGLIDVREWQAVVEMDTGGRIEGLPDGRKEYAGVQTLQRRFPFPGDLSDDATAWVTDIALEVDRLYQPSLLMLVYADLSFKATFTEGEMETQKKRTRSEIERFLEASGRGYAILGLGDMTELRGFVDLSGLDGIAMVSGFLGPFAGLFRPSSRDLAHLQEIGEVERLVTRDEFRSLFGGSDLFYQHFPDWLIELREGYSVRGFGSLARRPYRIPAMNESVPLATNLEAVARAKSITELEGALRETVASGERPVLVLVEGMGTDDFPWESRAISNRMGWFRYILGEGQYLAVSSGKHLVHHDYPPCLRYYLLDQSYPYSGLFERLPSGLLGQRAAGMTAAVGNRSICTHACLGADLTIECFARTLYNYGTLAVLR